VACLVAAASAVDADAREQVLVVATDRTSNGPLLVYPGASGMGGAPQVENWVLDNFAADPNTGSAMVVTAENVAREGGLSREALDDLTMLRYQQYAASLANDRAIQKRYMQPVRLPGRKGAVREIAADEGIHPYDRENLRSLKPAGAGGVVTFGSQTHPADGCAGAVVCSAARARELSRGAGVVRLIAASFARVEKAHMPKAATVAAQKVLAEAGVKLDQVKCVTTHNPFAVNDLWFSRQTGYNAERMNPYGCSLIYGHPQGPTGLRTIAELIEALREAGGGLGLFTGCAAGDTGGALLLSVE
jgi:acetyl-CoA C-acetyltransferase